LQHDINSSAIDKYGLDGTGFVDAGGFGGQEERQSADWVGSATPLH
jgi:hypothetical protein